MENIPKEHLIRISNAAITLSVYNLGPPIINIDFEDGLAITYEKIIPFDTTKRISPKISIKDIQKQINKKIDNNLLKIAKNMYYNFTVSFKEK